MTTCTTLRNYIRNCCVTARLPDNSGLAFDEDDSRLCPPNVGGCAAPHTRDPLNIHEGNSSVNFLL